MNNEIYNYCIKLLSKCDYSIYKITNKLNQKQFPEDQIETVINHLIRKKFINEEGYIRKRVLQFLEKGFSNSAIITKCELENLDVHEMVIEDVRNEIGRPAEDEIKNLINKKLKYKTIPTDPDQLFKFKQSIARFLQSKGHNYLEIEPYLEDMSPNQIQ
ncbi:MAG: regulatory protein [Thermoproteota archaeon]|jgi:regulatory protein